MSKPGGIAVVIPNGPSSFVLGADFTGTHYGVIARWAHTSAAEAGNAPFYRLTKRLDQRRGLRGPDNRITSSKSPGTLFVYVAPFQ